jgi:hypothetical protein
MALDLTTCSKIIELELILKQMEPSKGWCRHKDGTKERDAVIGYITARLDSLKGVDNYQAADPDTEPKRPAHWDIGVDDPLTVIQLRDELNYFLASGEADIDTHVDVQMHRNLPKDHDDSVLETIPFDHALVICLTNGYAA